MPITDFSEYPIGMPPIGWEGLYSSANIRNVIEDTPAVNNVSFELQHIGVSSYSPIMWTGGGNFGTCDIVQRVMNGLNSNATRVHGISVLGRHSGIIPLTYLDGDGGPEIYDFRHAIYAQFESNSITFYRGWNTVGPAYLTPSLPHGGASGGLVYDKRESFNIKPFNRDTGFWMKFSISGTFPDLTLKAKIWKSYDPEPDWMAIATTNINFFTYDFSGIWESPDPYTLSTPGPAYFVPRTGIYGITSNPFYRCDVFGVDAGISPYLDSPIKGVVLNASTLEPIADTYIREQGINLYQYTDENGAFSLMIPPGNRSLEAYADSGYVPDGNNIVEVTGHHPPGTTGVEILLTPVPYDIYTPLDLYHMRYDEYGDFRLMNDLDMTGFVVPEYDSRDVGESWSSYWYLYGTFDGLGHTIRNLKVDLEWDEASFLYDLADTGVIKNLSFDNVDWKGYYTGGIVAWNYGSIKNCSVAGVITPTEPDGYFGGITGWNDSPGRIEKCWSKVSIPALSEPAYYDFEVGGIAGLNEAVIEDCYHIGEIHGGVIGGIAGSNSGSIRRCYHAGNARVVGRYDLGDLVNSYYDADVSGLEQDNPYLGQARTTQEMTWPGNFDTTYIGWDFPTLWKIARGVNGSYPQFKVAMPLIYLSGVMAGLSQSRSAPALVQRLNGQMSATADWFAVLNGLFSMRGQIDAVSWWQAYKALMEIWAKRDGVYELVTPYAKVDGIYQPLTQVLRKTDDEWKV